MRRIPLLMAVLAPLCLASCLTLPSSRSSYVDATLEPGAMRIIAQDIAAKAALSVPPARTMLLVSPAPPSQTRLENLVSETLRRKGFAVQERTDTHVKNAPGAINKIHFLYQITQGKGLVLVRLELDNRLLARGYSMNKDTRSLIAAGPWSNAEFPH